MFEQFLIDLKNRGRTDHTIKSYISTWRRFERWMRRADPLQEIDITQATQGDIAAFKRYLSNEAGGRKGVASAGTLNKTFVQLNAIFKYFHKKGIVIDNPVQHVKKPPQARRYPKWHTRNEQNSILRTVRNTGSKRNYAMIVLMLRAGLRVEELVDVLLINVKVTDRKGSICVPPKNGDYERTVPLNSEARAAILTYLEERKSESSYLFVSQRSLKCTTRSVQHMIEAIRKKADFPGLTCHTLRHCFGHDLLTADPPVPIDQVAMLMGHFKEDGTPNIAMTMIYTTPSMEDFERAVETISWV